MHEISVADVIESESEQSIRFKAGESAVIQMPTEYINRMMALTGSEQDIFKLESRAPVYGRLTVRDHLKFYRKWYGSMLETDDILKQYELEACQNDRLSRCTSEIVQRMHYIHALFTDQKFILAINPLREATVKNIRLFHKVIEHLENTEKGIIVITSSTEEAFVLAQDILKLNDQGMKSVETESGPDGADPSFNRIKAKSQDKTIFVDMEDIDYIESSEGKVYINISREKFIIESTLAETEKKLGKYGFYRCHRSYIVNLNKVKEIITWSKNAYSIVIDNEERTKIPLSRTKYTKIQELLVM